MTPSLAKRLVLPLVRRWCQQTVWMVKWPDGNGSECRWFKNEETALEYANMLMYATVTRMTFPSGDDLPTLSDLQPPAVAVPYTP